MSRTAELFLKNYCNSYTAYASRTFSSSVVWISFRFTDVRILDRIRDNIDHNLAEPAAVSDDNPVFALTAVHLEMLFLFICKRTDHLRAFLHTFRRRKRLLVQIHMTILKLIDIENRVDQREQIISLGIDIFQCIFQSHRIVRVLLHNLCHAEHNVQRCLAEILDHALILRRADVAVDQRIHLIVDQRVRQLRRRLVVIDFAVEAFFLCEGKECIIIRMTF